MKETLTPICQSCLPINIFNLSWITLSDLDSTCGFYLERISRLIFFYSQFELQGWWIGVGTSFGFLLTFNSPANQKSTQMPSSQNSEKWWTPSCATFSNNTNLRTVALFFRLPYCINREADYFGGILCGKIAHNKKWLNSYHWSSQQSFKYFWGGKFQVLALSQQRWMIL